MNGNLFQQSETTDSLPRITPRKYRLFTNMALGTLSLSLTLIILELAVRLLIPPDSPRPFEFRIPHPVLGWVLQPNTTYLYELPEGTVSVTYNSQGWRDLEHEMEKPDGVFRILILGDSFMEANGVELGEAFHRQIEELARASGKNVEVINMGVAGYGPLQEYLVFRDIGHLYTPDLVLVGFYIGNDVQNSNLQLASALADGGQVRNARPYLDLNVSGLTIIPVDYEGAQRKYAENMASLESKRNAKFALSRLLTDALERIDFPGFSQSHENQPEPVDKEIYELALLGANYCLEAPQYTQAWDAIERTFTELKEEVEAHDAKLVIFGVPALEEVSLKYMEAVRADLVYPEKLCLEEAPGHARLNGMLTELDIEHISLLSDFRMATRDDGIKLYQTDLHWNPEGHALAAERVVSELIRRGFLP